MRRAFAALLFGLVASLPLSVQAGTVLSVLFDNGGFRESDYVGAPIIGSGQLSFDETLTDGNYPLLSLTNLQFSFTVGGSTFTSADPYVWIDPTADLVIYGSHFYFDGPGPSPLTGGVVDIGNASGFIAFEPSGLSPAPYNLYIAQTSAGEFFGIYGATPEPSTWCLAVSGAVLGLAGTIRRRRAAHAKSCPAV